MKSALIVGIVLLCVAACAPRELVSSSDSPLPTSTSRPIETSTPPPTTVPSIQTVIDDRLPVITHDLLFLSEFSLKRWNHLTGEIEILIGPDSTAASQRDGLVSFAAGPGIPAGGVANFSIGLDAQTIAILRSRADQPYFELALFDMHTREIRSLVPLTQLNVLQMDISPNGEWLAYILLEEEPAAARVAGLASPARGGGHSGAIYAVRTDGSDRQLEIGTCSGELVESSLWPCVGFQWSPASDQIAWSDGRGIWVAPLNQPAHQLTTNTLTMPNAAGEGVFRLQAWSPNARYILAFVGHYEGTSQAVIDIQTTRVAAITNTLHYITPMPYLTWMQDNRLLLIRAGDAVEHIAPAGEVWRVDAEHDPLLTLDAEFSIQAAEENFPTSVTLLADGRLAFTLVNASATSAHDGGLYFIDPNDLLPYKVNGLPSLAHVYPLQTIWSPDGLGAIVHAPDNNIRLYAPVDGGALYDLTPLLGEQATHFSWSR